MKNYFNIPKQLTKKDKQRLTFCSVALVLVGLTIALYLYNSPKSVKVTNKPAEACKLLTPQKAMSVLGDKIINQEHNKPTIVGNIATSGCSYSDTNENANNMMVAALLVRSGVNDAGITQNTSEYKTRLSKVTNPQKIGGIGDDAYFDVNFGQLNILRGSDWLIINYGIGKSPETHKLENATQLAESILGIDETSLPAF